MGELDDFLLGSLALTMLKGVDNDAAAGSKQKGRKKIAAPNRCTTLPKIHPRAAEMPRRTIMWMLLQ